MFNQRMTHSAVNHDSTVISLFRSLLIYPVYFLRRTVRANHDLRREIKKKKGRRPEKRFVTFLGRMATRVELIRVHTSGYYRYVSLYHRDDQI